MRSNIRIGPRCGLVAVGAALALWLAMNVAQGQVRDGAQSSPSTGASGREGGIPRKALGAERDRDRQEGLEEGTPDVESRPGFREALPRFRAPQGDWKLGVWAYNTDNGVVVTRVAPSSAAAREGLESGDRIVSVGGFQVGYVGDLLYPLGYELRRQADGRGQVLLLVQNVRDKELLNLSVQLDGGGRIRPLPLERP
jgi:PDZ domain-containing protein